MNRRDAIKTGAALAATSPWSLGVAEALDTEKTKKQVIFAKLHKVPGDSSKFKVSCAVIDKICDKIDEFLIKVEFNDVNGEYVFNSYSLQSATDGCLAIIRDDPDLDEEQRAYIKKIFETYIDMCKEVGPNMTKEEIVEIEIRHLEKRYSD